MEDQMMYQNNKLLFENDGHFGVGLPPWLFGPGTELQLETKHLFIRAAQAAAQRRALAP
jgi:hypothetical protein